MKRNYILHPFLIIIYLIVLLYHHNVSELPLRVLVMPLVVSFLIVLILYITLKILLKNKIKSGILIFLFAICFFSFGHFIDILIFSFDLGINNYLYFIYLLPYIFIFIPFFYLIVKTKRSLKDLNTILNGVTVVLLIVTLIQISLYKIQEHQELKIILDQKQNTISLPQQPKELPDVYYIILDGYTSQFTLREYYSFNNDNFSKDLKQRGFFVVDNGRSNYVSTVLSLASSLNMKYVNDLVKKLGIASQNKEVLIRMSQNSIVARTLKSIGYQFINYGSGYGPTRFNPYADINMMHLSKINEFSILLLRTTLLKAFYEHKTLYKKKFLVPLIFSMLSKNIKANSPKFVIAHFLSPHPPFLFHPNKNIIPQNAGNLFSWNSDKDYINEIRYLNRKVINFVNNVLTNSTIPPIIIIQGDHGSFMENPNKDRNFIRSSIFNAYYIPDKCKNNLYNEITPVNTFKVVFNCLFKLNLKFDEDKHYWSSQVNPYNMHLIKDINNQQTRN